MLINQGSNWSPRRYCKYAVTNNPAKVIGIKPNTIPNRKTSIILISSKSKKKGNIYLQILICINHESQWPRIVNWQGTIEYLIPKFPIH